MLDLILAYLKGISVMFDEMEENMVAECKSGKLSNESEIDNLVQTKVAEVDPHYPMAKIFSLKSVKECELEDNI